MGDPSADLAAPTDLGKQDAAVEGSTLYLVAGGLGAAGNGDGVGIAARFEDPIGMVADGAGNIYITEIGNDTIRKLVLATGAVTTVAGFAGMEGSTDATGTAARFYNPWGVALDGAGNMYVADAGNSTIRKIVLATGVVTTVAGFAGMEGSTDAAGATARFKTPLSLVFDGVGNLYIADTGNHTIRKMVLSTGMVTTVAGTAGTAGSIDATSTAAQFNSPAGLALDGAGNLYVSDTQNNTIRRIMLSTSLVTTVAGAAGSAASTDATGPAARFDHPGGLAVDGAGNLYISDTYNDTIRKMVLSSGVVTTLAGAALMGGSADGTGAAARLNDPRGLAVDGAGNLYAADSTNNTIRKVVLSSSAVTTLAGALPRGGATDGTGDAARFSSPRGVAVDGAGNIYIADSAQTIRKVVRSSGVTTTLAGTAFMQGSTDGIGSVARFRYPEGLALDGAGNLYVADSFNQAIRKVEVATGAVTTVAGGGVTGSVDGIGTNARFSLPRAVALDGAGNLYVADTENETIRKIVLSTGAVTTLAGSAGMGGSTDGNGPAARFRRPQGMVVDGAGNLYVSERYNQTIRKVVLATGEVSTLAGTATQMGSTDGVGAAARFSQPLGLTIDGAGNLFVADSLNHTIRRIRPANAEVSTLVGIAGRSGVQPGPLPALLNGPSAVAAYGGVLFIVDTTENAVLEVR